MLNLSFRCCMDNEDLVGQSGDEFIPAPGGACIGTAWRPFEAGQDKKASVIQREPPIGRNPHFSYCSCGTHDNGLLSFQENPQALFFYGRVKTTDHGHTFIT